MRNKKSQTEILGLAIIVVFIAIGMLFVVKFMINQPADDTREEFIRSELANNILSSVIDANTPCRSQDISELLKDCAENNPGDIKCGDMYSCEYAEQETTLMISNFMEAMGHQKNYKFRVTLNQDTLILLEHGNCTIWESANQPLPTYKGNLNVQLLMCK